jgi:hypothetical protein
MTPQSDFTQWAKQNLESYTGQDMLDGDPKLYALTALPMPAWQEAFISAQISQKAGCHFFNAR